MRTRPVEVRLFTFRSTHETLRAEEPLVAAEIDYQLIPTPRVVKAGCGLALACAIGDSAAAEAAFEVAGMKPDGSYVYTRSIVVQPRCHGSDEASEWRA